jgi:glutamyl-tRNA synthetase
MHIGGVRTALYAWLWARKNGGKFILRIEDTDKEREVEGSTEHIMESLKWLGIEWDEGPDKGGPNAPYKQSERLEIYKKYAEKLIDKGLAYPDPYTEEELNSFRKKSEEEKKPFLYRDYRPKEFGTWDGTKALRFKVTDIKTSHWTDAARGELSAGPEALDDLILIKSDGYPTYNFAHIVDDLEMGVTHIMRSDEFISSTPRFLSLYEALEITPPIFVTLPPILGEGGKKKLGKRDGAKDILDYRAEGYLPEAMINFLALLGWNPGTEQEIFSKEELIGAFDISRIQVSGAQAGQEKLDWINREHIKKLSPEELQKNIFEWLPEKMRNPGILPVITERIYKWGDVRAMADRGELDVFFQAPAVDKAKLPYKGSSPEETKLNLEKVISALENIDAKDFTLDAVKRILMDLSAEMPSRGAILHPVRYALSGRDQSPDPFTIASVIGKDETISRLQKAL